MAFNPQSAVDAGFAICLDTGCHWPVASDSEHRVACVL
jgi:hypothetical protein